MAAFTVVCQVAFSSLWLHSAIAQLLKSGGNGRLERLVFFSAKTEPGGSRNGPKSNGGQLCNLMLPGAHDGKKGVGACNAHALMSFSVS